MKNYHNIRSSFENDNTVYTTNGVVQDLKELSNTHWLDAIGTRTGVQYEKYVYDFDGVNSKIDTNIFPPTLTGEVEMRIKITQEGTIFSNRNNSSNYFEVLGGNLNDSLITIDLKESPNHYVISSNFINDGDWHKINIRYTGFSLYIYIDDQLDKIESSLTLITSNLDKLFIGCRSNSSHFVTMQLAEFKWKSLQNIILIWYKCEEQLGTTAYDSSGYSNNGTLLGGITHTTTRNNKLINYTNLVGYSTLNNVIIPRDESNTDYDVLGNLLQNNGEVANNVKLINSNAIQVDTTTEAHLNFNAVTLMITSYGGTATPTLDVNNNKITFTDGIIYDLKLFDYAYGVQIDFPLAEGSGSTSYSIDNGYTLTWINTHNWILQDEYHYNILNGFSTDNDVRLPFMHLKVEDYPLLWINQNYYYNYKDNIFKVPYQLDQSVWVGDDIDYDGVQTISLSNKSLNTDFTPTLLNKFQNLTTLDISSNNITNIDLSNNLNLQNIRVGYNKVTSYDLTNLSNLPSVTYFDLQGSIAGYEVNNIDINHLTSLTAVVVTDQHISNIDVSNLTNLNSLNLSNNSTYLTSIDVSNNILLDNLTLNNNSLSTINVSNNPNITYLALSNNELTSLDITNNANITYLTTNDNLINSDEHEIILEKLVNHNKYNGLFKSNVYDGYLTFQSIDYVNTLLSRNWTIQTLEIVLTTGNTYNVEDFPLNWINGSYYSTYKNNTFEVNSTMPMLGKSDYDSILSINLTNQGLNTNFSNTLLEKFSNINTLNLANNNISLLDLSKSNNLLNVQTFNNLLTTSDVSKIYTDLDKHNLTGGYLKVNTSNNQPIDLIGQLAYQNLIDKNWNVETQGLLNAYSGAAVAYSLHLLNDDYTGPVINVRRASDNTTLDIGFNGVDLDVESLEAFCQPNTVIYQSDFTNGNEDLSEFSGIGTDGETVAGVSDAYKFELTGGVSTHQTLYSLPEDSAQYSMTFNYYIPSTNAKIDGITVLPKLGGGSGIFGGVDQWTTATIILEVPEGQLPRLRFFPSDGNTYVNIDADGDVFYLKDIQVTQLTTNGYVTVWYDQSGNNYNSTQTTSSAQPKIVSSGSVILENSKPVISFDGVDDTLQYDFSPDKVQPFSLFFVRRYRDVSSTYVGIGVDSTPNTGYAEIANGIQFRTYYGTYLVNGSSNTNQGLWYSLGNGTNSEIGLDSNTAITGNAGTGGLEVLSIGSAGGSAFFAPINTQSVIIYNSNQSVNRAAIEKNINSYYNIYSTQTGNKLLNYYPNAAVSYSLRKEDSNYTGAAVNVRRASDNTTLDIGFAGNDLDIASLETFCNPNFLVDVDMDTDTNGNGMLDVFLRISNRGTPSLVTGNGHIGQAQRLDGDATGLAGIYSDIFPPMIGQEITISFMYRSNVNITLTNGASTTQFPLAPANTGNAIRYEETRVWNPTSGADGRLTFSWLNGVNDWYEISDLSVTIHTADGYVTTWYDQSGNGYDATQTTSSAQPKIVSAGSVILENNKPAIEAVDIFNALLVPSFTSATQMTTVAISRLYDISANRYITDSTSGRYIVGVFSGTQKYTAFRSAALSGDTAQTTKSSLYFATFDGANSTITNDAGTTYTGDAGTSTFMSLRLMSGVGSGFNGNVQSVIVYNSDQSANRIGIEYLLNEYYNIFPFENLILSPYIQRVQSDGGIVESQNYLLQILSDLYVITIGDYIERIEIDNGTVEAQDYLLQLFITLNQ